MLALGEVFGGPPPFGMHPPSNMLSSDNLCASYIWPRFCVMPMPMHSPKLRAWCS